MNATTSPNPILEEEKQTFYKTRGYKVNPYQTIGLRSPGIEFWIDRLNHPDSAKRRQAFDKFHLALEDFSIRVVPTPADPDVGMIQQMALVFQLFAEQSTTETGVDSDTGIRSYETFTFFRNQPSLLALVERITPYLSEGATRIQANKILNFFTLDCYTEKDPEWWKTEFPNSKLAGLFGGLPPWEWPKRKE